MKSWLRRFKRVNKRTWISLRVEHVRWWIICLFTQKQRKVKEGRYELEDMFGNVTAPRWYWMDVASEEEVLAALARHNFEWTGHSWVDTNYLDLLRAEQEAYNREYRFDREEWN